jgi:uncharacterized cupredoxin-like copper-binding protein
MRTTRAVIATAAAASLAGAALAVAAPKGSTVNVAEKEWKITRASPAITLEHGKSYTFAVHNTGKFKHDLLIDGKGVEDVGIHNRSPIVPGSSKSFTITFPHAGTYTLYCAIPGHKAKGMELKVTVK